jgi:hypothetical protein
MKSKIWLASFLIASSFVLPSFADDAQGVFIRCSSQVKQNLLEQGDSFVFRKSDGLITLEMTRTAQNQETIIGRVRVFPDFITVIKDSDDQIRAIKINQSDRKTFGKGNRVKLDLEFAPGSSHALKNSLQVRVVENDQVRVYDFYQLLGALESGGRVSKNLNCQINSDEAERHGSTSR